MGRAGQEVVRLFRAKNKGSLKAETKARQSGLGAKQDVSYFCPGVGNPLSPRPRREVPLDFPPPLGRPFPSANIKVDSEGR